MPAGAKYYPPDLYPYLIVGAGDKDSKGRPIVHPRLEIETLRQKEIQFSIFIRALNTVLERKTEYGILPDYLQRPDSWWQIGGIHGLPNEPWSGDPDGPQQTASAEYGGYCYHGSALFPPWHRVLLLLVEQVIVREAKAYASKLPDGLPEKKFWVQAANELRLPYWDWTNKATSKRGLPEIFRWSKIFIVSPTNVVDDEVPNPLNRYQFPENHKLETTNAALIGMGRWSRTYRWVNFEFDPPKEEYKQAREQVAQLLGSSFDFDDALRSFRKGGGPRGFKNERVTSLRQKVAGLFKYPVRLKASDEQYKPNVWGHFASTASDEVYLPKDRYHSLPSIEDPHNKVHLDVGGFGTMAFNEFAGFDPIFYLHHCNIDRIYAFWEWLYPDYWIGEDGWVGEDGKRYPFANAKEGNFGQDGTGQLKASTDLLPFRITRDTYWTSEKARGLLTSYGTPKYYTYPAIKDDTTGVKIEPHKESDELNKATNPKQRREIREKYRQALYHEWGTDIATDVRNIREGIREWGANWPTHIKHLLLHWPDTGDDGYLRNYVIVGEVPEFAFAGSYRLELYLPKKVVEEAVDDDFLDSPAGGIEPHVIDDISVFGRIDPDKCDACVGRRAGENKVRGHILLEPLTILLLIVLGKPSGNFPTQQYAVEWLYTQIKRRIRLRYVKPNGEEIADTETTDNDGREFLEADKIPKLTLYWHTVWFKKSDLAAQQTEHTQAVDLDIKDQAQGEKQEDELDLTNSLGGKWKKRSDLYPAKNLYPEGDRAKLPSVW